jgi:hypothetical protein
MLDTLEEQMLLGRVAGDVSIKCCGYGLPDDTQDCDATTLKRRPVAALHPELEPKRMQWFFTYRDKYMGIARDPIGTKIKCITIS